MRGSNPCHNAISNSEFDSGTDNWSMFQQTGSSATVSHDNTGQLSGNNSARVDITAASGTGWHLQLVQREHTLIAGTTYTFSFEAKSTANRTIYAAMQLGESPWTTYFAQAISLTSSPQTFSFEYTPTVTNTSNISVLFNLAGSSETVWIDNIVLSEACSPEICGNGIDDDNDKLVDDNDPDCSGCSFPTPVPEGFDNAAIPSGVTSGTFGSGSALTTYYEEAEQTFSFYSNVGTTPQWEFYGYTERTKVLENSNRAYDGDRFVFIPSSSTRNKCGAATNYTLGAVSYTHLTLPTTPYV